MRKKSLYTCCMFLPLLTSCSGDIGSSAKSLGDYMPTIGERCESSECITESGKAQSERIKQERLRHQNAVMGKPMPPEPTPYDSYEAQ